MNNKDYYLLLKSIHKRIKYYEKMINITDNLYQRRFYESLLYYEKKHLNFIKSLEKRSQPTREQVPIPNQKTFSIDELAKYDGSNGKPAYVAVNGIVYDVSLVASWGGGTHFSLYAGKDLSPQFNGCHSDRLEILNNLPQVGVLEE